MSETKTFDILYFSNKAGEGRKFSHQYAETWERYNGYCPNCSSDNVWHETSGGDYYVGERFICTSCEHGFYLPSVFRADDEQDSQRLAKLQERP